MKIIMHFLIPLLYTTVVIYYLHYGTKRERVTREFIGEVVIGTVGFVACGLLHELGHALGAIILEYEVIFRGFGNCGYGVIAMAPSNATMWQNAPVILGGPLVSFMLFLGLHVIKKSINQESIRVSTLNAINFLNFFSFTGNLLFEFTDILDKQCWG